MHSGEVSACTAIWEPGSTRLRVSLLHSFLQEASDNAAEASGITLAGRLARKCEVLPEGQEKQHLNPGGHPGCCVCVPPLPGPSLAHVCCDTNIPWGVEWCQHPGSLQHGFTLIPTLLLRPNTPLTSQAAGTEPVLEGALPLLLGTAQGAGMLCS